MHHHEFRRWLRHMAAVPKGYLKMSILQLLSEKPMSGAEIMEEIYRRSGGVWKPSPGSVYPLLAWLQDNGYIKEVQRILGNGSKRYTLTDKGKQMLEELRKQECKCFRRGPPLLSWMLSPWIQAASSTLSKIIGEAYLLFEELQSLGEEYSGVVSEVEDVLRRAVDEIREILRRAKEGKSEGEAGAPFKWSPPR
ncbi:MAG: PadR family transcriptional regulator [Candidatus Jordarchaeales archaeon]